VWVAAVAALAFFSLTMVALGLVLVVWDRFGAAGLFVLSAAGLAGTALALWGLCARWKPSQFLPETLAELKKDVEWLEGEK
jgi:uncharacterized membrane protein YqjE